MDRAGCRRRPSAQQQRESGPRKKIPGRWTERAAGEGPQHSSRERAGPGRKFQEGETGRRSAAVWGNRPALRAGVREPRLAMTDRNVHHSPRPTISIIFPAALTTSRRI